MAKEIMSSRIHILGLGSVGVLVAHAIAQLRQRPHLTLMLHRPVSWDGHTQQLRVKVDDKFDDCSGFDFEELRDGHWQLNEKARQPGETKSSSHNTAHNSPISIVIVAVKANYTASVLETIKHRLSSDSTILFLQNGMGVMEEVDERVFSSSTQRPHYMVGVNTHGTARYAPLSASHLSPGEISFGIAPRILAAEKRRSRWQQDPRDIPSARCLVETLIKSPNLNARLVGVEEILQLQVNKLAVNAVHNPLTALLECDVGTLYSSRWPGVQALMELMLKEISAVLISLLLPFQTRQDLEAKFTTQKLASMLKALAQRHSCHKPSMMQDMMNRVPMEIDYINGFLVKSGTKLGVDCIVNDSVIRMLLEKQQHTVTTWEY